MLRVLLTMLGAHGTALRATSASVPQVSTRVAVMYAVLVSLVVMLCENLQSFKWQFITYYYLHAHTRGVK